MLVVMMQRCCFTTTAATTLRSCVVVARVQLLLCLLLLSFTSKGGTTLAQQVTTCETGKVKLEVEIKTDMFPEETSFTLVNVCDQTVLLTVKEGDLENMSETKQYSWCVEDPSAYKITVMDKFDDGMMEDGHVQVKYNGKVVFNSGKFFKSTDRTFGYCAGQPMPSAAPSQSAEPSLAPTEPPTKMPTFTSPDKCQTGEQRFVLDLLTDIFAEELSFELKNNCNGNTVVQAKTNTLRAGSPYKITRCLSPGDGYTFNISDASGDGLYPPAFYSLQLGDEMLVNATSRINVSTITSFGRCTAAPSAAPSQSFSPSALPTSTAQPTITNHPTAMPSPTPTKVPSLQPSPQPSDEPSHKPTRRPTPRPTSAPVTKTTPAPVAPVTPDPNANCPCNNITNAIKKAICRRLYPKRCPS